MVEHSQRLVASQLERLAKPIVGLEETGANRLAANGSKVFLGGKDGVVTSYSAGKNWPLRDSYKGS